jgi:hypothetical protein
MERPATMKAAPNFKRHVMYPHSRLICSCDMCTKIRRETITEWEKYEAGISRWNETWKKFHYTEDGLVWNPYGDFS